jgi:hypothetical protein
MGDAEEQRVVRTDCREGKEKIRTNHSIPNKVCRCKEEVERGGVRRRQRMGGDDDLAEEAV